MSIPIRILIVEDAPGDAELMLGNLADYGFAPQSERVETEADYLAGLNAAPDVILADYRLPHFSGPRALELLNARAVDIPFIGVSGTVGDEQVAGLMKQGACDFLLKDRMARLGPAVAQALNRKRARDERRRLEAALAESEEKFRLICETSTDAVVLLDDDNRIRYANPGIRDVFGYAPDEVEGKHIAILQPARLLEQHQQCVKRILETGVKTQNRGPVERLGLHRDGHEFPVEISYSHTIMRGKPGFVGVIRDITERKRTEEEIKAQAQQLARSNEELTRFNRFAAGRELRMIELKQEVNDLAAKLGRPRPYALAFTDAAAALIVRSTPMPTESPSFSERSKTSSQKEQSQ